MKSEIIKDLHNTDFGYEGKIYLQLFEKEIDIFIDKDTTIEYAEKCVKYLQNLNNQAISDLCESAINYFNHYLRIPSYLEYYESDVPLSVEGKEILNYMYPETLIISKSPNSSDIGFKIEGDVGWGEVDGGEVFSWVVKNGKTLYMGNYLHHSPWEKTEKYQSKWNYANTFYKKPTEPLIIPENLKEKINQEINVSKNKVILKNKTQDKFIN